MSDPRSSPVEQDPSADDILARVAHGQQRAREALLRLQHDDGHWRGELEGDTILESEYALLLWFLGRRTDPRLPRLAETIRRQALPGGGWAIYPGGPVEVSASVKNYFVLKLMGDDPHGPLLASARRAILERGGVEACNSFTRIYLAIFGQIDWSRCPAVPPEIVLLPTRGFFHLYEMSSWSRGIVVPLSIIWARKPRCEVPPEAGIGELFTDDAPSRDEKIDARERLWRTFFVNLDRGLKLMEQGGLKPLRQRALERAERWIHEHLEQSDGIGAIFPPIVNTVYALVSLGYRVDHPVVASQLAELERLEIAEGDTLRVQPCLSPVWDTGLTLNALLESGLPGDHPALRRAAEWLLDREVRRKGDWQVKVPDVEPGGWYFEYANEFYPDCDDTAEVLTALARIRFPDEATDARRRAAIERGTRWLLAMQNRDGGWAAFDRGCDKESLTYIPFADHNAMIDPSTADITGRALLALATLGFDANHPAVRRGVAFLERQQEPDGTWYGRWGCNYIYGTWLALTGLSAAGESMKAERYRRAARWLREHQNPDGGWGESLASYDDPSLKGRGESTASQTAWAILALLAAGDVASAEVRRGVGWLLENQDGRGLWAEDHWTGTGFPRVFYLKYHLYAAYFPLLALSAFRNRLAARRDRSEAA